MSADGLAVLYPAARWLGYLAAFLIIGAAVFRWWVLPRVVTVADPEAAPLVAGTIRIARLAAVLLAIATVARLYLQLRSFLEPDEPITLDFAGALMARPWGRGWLAQGMAAMVTLIGWRMLGRNGRSGTGRWLAGAGAIGVALTAPLTGHAMGLPAAGAIGYPLMVAHFAAGGAWLGTLAVMLLVALRRSTGTVGSPPAVVAAFSPLALVMGSVVMAAGAIVAWRYVGSWNGLFETTYGRVLLLKLAALLGVAGTGAYNWRVILPRLRQGRSALITRTAAIELGVGAVLLAVTAVLVGLAAPSE